jgi:hypothetical protein
MSTVLEFRFDGVPKSVNSLYFSRGGRRILSDAGRKFKNAFVTSRGGLTAAEILQFEQVPDGAYHLELWFFLKPERLYNLTYGSDKRVKSAYKKIDVSNLVKLAEDAIAKLTGIHDQANFTVIAHKRVTTGDEWTLARLQPLDLDNDPHAFDRRKAEQPPAEEAGQEEKEAGKVPPQEG